MSLVEKELLTGSKIALEMMTMNKQFGIELKFGSRIIGKWHQNQYIIRRKLGSGTVGTVYLCERNGQQYALKISRQSSSMIVEVNVLKALEKVQGTTLGPSLIDADDYESHEGTFSFYVMEYIRGIPLPSFIQQKGVEWIGVFMLQILKDLEKL